MDQSSSTTKQKTLCPGCHVVCSLGMGIPTPLITAAHLTDVFESETGNVRDFLVEEKLLQVPQPGPLLLSSQFFFANLELPDPPITLAPKTSDGARGFHSLGTSWKIEKMRKRAPRTTLIFFFLFFPSQTRIAQASECLDHRASHWQQCCVIKLVPSPLQPEIGYIVQISTQKTCTRRCEMISVKPAFVVNITDISKALWYSFGGSFMAAHF